MVSLLPKPYTHGATLTIAATAELELKITFEELMSICAGASQLPSKFGTGSVRKATRMHYSSTASQPAEIFGFSGL